MAASSFAASSTVVGLGTSTLSRSYAKSTTLSSGWLAPSSIPIIDGNSLSGLFFSSIGDELAHFPTPPAVVAGIVAFGVVLVPNIWADRLQRKD
ncbi:hypothetical protein KSS87_002029 [Heliosperma pusillum]|nr:hypothetical protein KSS87_002029 [Heliosperma pusillum]